jgi:class 3 adenylate cyclase/tetratricopeptide (TPR) repeat protein
MDFYELLARVVQVLQREGRTSYRALKRQFDLDEALLDDLQEELVFKRLAIDEEGKGLVWTGTIVPGTAHDGPTSASEPAQQPAEAERRQVTVMFCDLVDSTKLAQQLDPEQYRAVVRAYQAAAVAAMQPYDGYVAQYLGDGIMVYFGWPTAHEDTAQRAVYASLAIIEAMPPLNDTQLAPQYGVRVQLRIGLHTGMAVIGEMGSGDRHEHLAMGDTPNIASRIQGIAAPDTVALSATTARLLHGAFALEELGPHTLKGVAEPMQVFQALDAIDLHADESEVAALAKPPFLVGRDEEIGLLLRRWEQAQAGHGQVVLLSGEAGIGKSSLVEMLRAQVREQSLPRIALRCSPYHRNSALFPVMTHLERLLRFERHDAPEHKLDKLERGLQTSRLPLADTIPLFAALLSLPLPEGRYAALPASPQQRKQQTLDALVTWLMAEGEHQPLLMLWEDLHWADPSSLELLDLLVEQVPTVHMLTVLTYRPEFQPSWPQRSHLTPITLNRLERPQVEALIAHVAGNKALPAAVIAHIVDKTDGVPLFVEELTKMLLESAFLHEEADHYTLTGPLSAVAIPATLQDSLMARLDQLPSAKEMAQLGAVLGREFPYELLAAIAPRDEASLQAGLAQLVQAELLYQRGRPPRATYVFKHALIQDAAYASLLKSTRQHVHRHIAEILEARFPTLVEMRPELVAQHYTTAGCAEQAVVYWQRAGQQASDRSAHLEAVSHLSTGIELLQTLPETPEHTQQALTLYVALGAALIITKGQAVPEVEHAYTQAYALCQQVGETPQLVPVLYGLWRFYLVRSQFHTAYELGETLLRLAQHAVDPALAVIAHYTLGSARLWLGELSAARQHLEAGMAHYTPDQRRIPVFRIGHDPGVACRFFTAQILWLLGYPAQALARLHDTLVLAHELSHPYSLA